MCWTSSRVFPAASTSPSGARQPALHRPEATGQLCPCPGLQSPHPHPRRGHLQRGYGYRTAHPRRPGAHGRRPNKRVDCPSPLDRAARRNHPGDAQGPVARDGQATSNCWPSAVSTISSHQFQYKDQETRTVAHLTLLPPFPPLAHPSSFKPPDPHSLLPPLGIKQFTICWAFKNALPLCIDRDKLHFHDVNGAQGFSHPRYHERQPLCR